MPDLDSLLQGGYLKGSTTLISGAPGTAKSTLATAFALSSAQSGHRTLYVSFDETERQIALHMASVGYHVRPEVEAGNLRLAPLQAHGLPPEVHVSNILRAVDEFHAEVVIIDPISGIMQRSHSFMSRTTEYLLAQLRDRGITMPCTTLLDRTTTAAVGWR
ncbi:MAG: hypothetical protein B7Y93_02260 [Micrococcales bacterium 32-70-13]|nr:MAG: hypothetical protein B7Y93_02260 [Micrococcales bacterium 32-70-13]